MQKSIQNKYILFLFCLLIPFENSFLGDYGGAFTKSLAFLILPIMLLFIVIGFSRGIYQQQLVVIKIFCVFFIYSLLMSFNFLGFDAYFVYDRGLRFFLISTPPVIIILFLLHFDEQHLKSGVIVCFSIVLFSYFLNLIFPDFINGRSFLQNSEALSSHRLRGFTLEASTFGFQLVLSTLLFSFYIKRNKFILPILVLLSISTTSKGSLICLLLSIACYMFVVNKNKSKFFLIPVSIIVFYYIFNVFVLPSLMNDMENYTTVVTRGSVMFLSLLSVFNYPLGAGYFGYLPVFYTLGGDAVNLFSFFFPDHTNFSEIDSYLVPYTTESVGAKSFLFDWVIFMGLPFIYFFIKFNFYLLRMFYSLQMQVEFIATCFLFLSLCFYVPFETRYIAPFAYVVLFSRIRSGVRSVQ